MPTAATRPSSEDQMGVGVHQTGSDKLTARVDHAVGCRSLTGADGGDHALFRQDPGVFQQDDLPLVVAALGGPTRGRGKLTDVPDQRPIHFTASIAFSITSSSAT